MKSNIKNLDKAAERIKQAVTNNETIILYGDSDMDGISSVVILQEAIKNIGGSVSMALFPDRENDGYGLNLKALDFLQGKSPALLITLDLGIANHKEIDMANAMGFEVVVVDHHEILGTIPNASIVVDPKQPGDVSGATYLCNGGLTFKLAEELLGAGLSENSKNSMLELAALATISDMMPQIEDNKTIIEQGLRSLKNTFRPGLIAFLDILGKGEVVAGGFLKVISALNASESVHFKNESYTLLINSDTSQCRQMVEALLGKVAYKQQKIKEITEEVERRLAQNSDNTIIFEGDPAWKLTLAGPAASIIAQRHQKPTFIFKKGDTESCGSVRSLKEGENSVDAMRSCSDILMTYGGHPKASGFRLKNENVEKFKTCLTTYFKNR